MTINVIGTNVPIELSKGGTNANLSASAGGVFYSTASAAAILPGTSTANQVLVSGSNSAPSWSTATFPSTAGSAGTILRSDGTNWVASTATFSNTYSASNLLYSNGSNTVTGLSSANNGLLITSNSGVPSILAGPGTSGQVLQSNSAAAPSFSTASYPSIATSSGTMLRANGTNWIASTATFADTYSASTILYSNGSNTVTGLATANSSVLVTTSAGVPVQAGTMTNGQLIIGSTGATPAVASLTAGTNVTITNGAGSITVSCSGPASFTWNTVSGTTQTAAVNNGYTCTNAGTTTVTMPATAAVNSIIEVIGSGSGGLVLQAASGQNFVSSSASGSVTGTCTAAVPNSSIKLICTIANTRWQMVSASGVFNLS